MASNDDKRKPKPTIPHLRYPTVFEPPRKKIKEEPISECALASNDDERKLAPTIPHLPYPTVFEPPRKKIKEEPLSE